jgi:protoporphyrinogen oxidase
VFSNGVYTRYPFQANTFGLPASVAYECLYDFIQTKLTPSRREPLNFEDFCLAHFGAGFSRHFMLPYNEKLWGVSAREITSAWCQRFVPLPKLEDVLAGAVGPPAAELGYNSRFLYPRRGIGALPRALSRGIEPLQLNSAPRELRAERRELVFDERVVGYDALLSTIPLPALLGLFDALPPEVAEARGRLRSTALAYLDLALSRPALKAFHWVYVPEPKYPFYRVGCYSNFSAHMAPDGTSNLYVELAERRPMSLSRLLEQVIPGLVEMGVIASASDILFARLRELEPAYVIYDHAYEAALATIKPFLESQRVLSTGRYGGWNYSSMEDALLFGRDGARRAAAWLDRAP